jgi:hypothetical protein
MLKSETTKKQGQLASSQNHTDNTRATYLESTKSRGRGGRGGEELHTYFGKY